MKEAALEYHNLGFNIVPMLLSGTDKKPLVEWQKWNTERQTEQEFNALPWDKTNAFAVVCGTQLKNGLFSCVIDQDVKNLSLEIIEKGKEAIKRFPITQMEKTPSGGLHYVYYSHQKPKTISTFHNDYGLELLGEKKLCLMYPSEGYLRLNDNTPTEVNDLTEIFYNVLGAKAEDKTEAWFDREDLTVKTYEGDHPLCIRELLKGVNEGLRNEAAIRLSSYLVNFRGMGTEKALWHLKRWNKLNNPSLADAELLEVFKSSLKGYVFGCNDPLLKNHCVEEGYCPLRKKEQKQPEKEKVYDEVILSKARTLLADPEFFYKLGEVFEKGFMVPKINKPRFVIGEERNKRLLGPLLIGSSKLAMTSIIKVLGEPGTAKDTMLRMWLVLLGIKYVERSYITAASLRYSPDMQNADLLYIPDTPELQGEMGRQLRFMRSDDGGLISEYAVRDAVTGEMTTKVVTLPIKGLATTSNAVTGDVALESGMWTLTTNPSPELTKEVKKEKLKLRAGERPLISDDDLNLWQAVFRVLLEEDPQEIPLVPYAKQLFELLESERTESRRDPDKLCDLISLIAWMRRFQKEPDKRMEGDLIDLYFALQLGLDAITQTISELSPKEQQIFEAVKTGEAVKETVTCRAVADSTKIPYKTCYVYLEKLVDKGYLNQDKEKNRNIYSILSKETEPKSFLFSLGRNEENLEQLVKVVLATVRNSSTDKPLGEDTYTFVDPLKGCQIIVKRNGEQDEVTIDTQRYVYPSPLAYQRGSSEPSKKPVSESEKKPNSLLPSENRTENNIEALPKLSVREVLTLLTAHWQQGTQEEFQRLAMQAGNLTEAEARSLFEQLVDEGKLGMTPDGLWKWC